MWNHFFCVRCLRYPDTELAVWGGMSSTSTLGMVLILFRHPHAQINEGVAEKKWFYLRNDADAPLPMFTDNYHVPQPN
jgi:hypothetical protein